MTAAALAGWQDPKALWYLNRATGLVLLVLLTLAVLLGQASVPRTGTARLPRFVAVDLHRNAALLGLGLLFGHVLTSVADGFVDIRLVDAVLPLRSPYRPVWLGAGTLAVDLLLVIGLTTAVRHRLGLRGWTAVHRSAYAAWALAVVHGLGTGTDTRRGWVLGVTLGCLLAGCLGALLRLLATPGLSPAARAAGLVAVLLVPVLVSAWLGVGPLRPDWSRPAGTPPPAGALR